MPPAATRFWTRLARESDIGAIRQVFLDTYGSDYAYPQFYDEAALLHMVHADDLIMTVAEDPDTDEIVGTASVVLKVGAARDLLGEAGRLAVRPPDRNRGAGTALMGERLRHATDRLELIYAENRTAHPYSQRISRRHGFVPVGLLPTKCRIGRREHLSLWIHCLGTARALRLPEVRVVHEARALAELALATAGFPTELEVVDAPAPARGRRRLQFEALTADTYPQVLTLPLGRTEHRTVFGPVSLADGLPRLHATGAIVRVAREQPDGTVVGALLLHHDFAGQGLRLGELVAADSDLLPDLVEQGLAHVRAEHTADYIEVDVSAAAPATQRLFLDQGFFPAAYVPAMRFDRHGRRDILKLARLQVPMKLGVLDLLPEAVAVSDLVLAGVP